MFLKIIFFEFNGEGKRQKSGTAFGTKFAPPYGCIFMDKVEMEFFFIWTHGTQELDSFLNEPNKFDPNLSFTYETSKE